ncbi:MAG: pyruvate dehydrogenase complex E1 component subunit beta [Proteobacteria bacterium]|nr:pyruvate dehydrogenase complex E1 component subunit beta [Pseudomonadota bacterium]
MATAVRMPALSPTMTHGKLARWLKAEGDAVAAGDALAEIETDKATMEVEAVDEGVLGRLVVAAGTEDVAVNDVIAVVLEDGEGPEALANFVAGGKVATATPSEAPPAATSTPTPPAVSAPAVGSAIAASAPEPAASGAHGLAPEPVASGAHGLAPEPVASGALVSLTVREALRDAMAEEMRRDPDVFLMGEEVAEYHGAYKVSQGLLEEFGDRRVIDTPITEYGFAHLAVGAAYAGLKPIVEFMTFNFAMQAIDAIVNSAAKTLYMSGGRMPVPIVFRGPNGAAARVAAQHSQDFAPWYASVPGLKVVAPYSAADAKGLLKAAIRDPNPVVFLENELLYGRSFEVPVEEFVLPIGKARVARAGNDVTLVGYSIAVDLCLNAADLLAADGIDAEVIDLRTLRPLDTATVVASVRKTNRIVSVEQAWPFVGIGAEMSAQVMEQAFDDLDAPVARVSAQDVPLPYAANLEQLALPSAEQVAAAARAVCYR